MKNEVSCGTVAVGNKKLVAAARISACIQIEHTNTRKYFFQAILLLFFLTC